MKLKWSLRQWNEPSYERRKKQSTSIKNVIVRWWPVLHFFDSFSRNVISFACGCTGISVKAYPNDSALCAWWIHGAISQAVS